MMRSSKPKNLYYPPVSMGTWYVNLFRYSCRLSNIIMHVVSHNLYAELHLRKLISPLHHGALARAFSSSLFFSPHLLPFVDEKEIL